MPQAGEQEAGRGLEWPLFHQSTPPQATADPMQTPDAKDIQLLNNSCAHFLQKNDKIEQNEEPRVFQSSHQLEITQANT